MAYYTYLDLVHDDTYHNMNCKQADIFAEDDKT